MLSENAARGYSYKDDVREKAKKPITKNSKPIKKRILVIDDEHDINLVFKLVLEHNGFDVNTFIDPLEALQDLRTGSYDMILLDVRMPTMNGLSVCQEIRKLNDIVKICFLTAGDLKDEEFRKQIFPTSIKEDQFIRKPVSNEELVIRVKEILRE
jgi:two-component system response regulator ArlR